MTAPSVYGEHPAADVQEVILDYEPRQFQWDIHDACSLYRFVVAIVHRRGGKTIAALNEIVRRCVTEPGVRCAYIAPSLVQASRIAWAPLGDICRQVPGSKEYKAERRWRFPNGSEVLLLGVDNFDANRGMGFDYVVLDETALFPYGAWDEVIRPALADKRGGALFIGTLDEGGILLDDLNTYARTQDDPDWMALDFNVEETHALDPQEVESLKRTMSPEAFAREFMNQKLGAKGSYYAAILTELERDSRILKLPPLTRAVNVCTDLGMADSTSLWFWQQTGAEIRWLHSYENEGQSADYYGVYIAQWLAAHDPKLLPGTVYLPHDGNNRYVVSQLSVADILRGQGFKVEVVQTNKIGLDRGIEGVRQVLRNSWFDAAGTHDGRKALFAYRRSFNATTGTLRDTPLHDWSSHYADAMRTGACAIKSLGVDKLPSGSKRGPMRMHSRPNSFMVR